MSKKAAEFVTKLSQDPTKREAFKADPEATMDEHGLSDEDKAVLRTGDPDTIREYLGDDGPPGCFAVFV